jgi:hypothetical protein
MKKWLVLLLTVGPVAARADLLNDDGGLSDTQRLAISSVQEAAALPLTYGGAHPYSAVVTGYGGYDSARNAAIFDIVTEVKVWGPFSIRGGGTYLSDINDVKPIIGGVVQFLDQPKHGVSASFGVFYKPEGLTEPEGEIEGVLALSHVFDGRTTAAMNLVYGQDGEAVEKDGEIKLAILHRLRRALFVGFDTRLRFAIGDPKPGDPSLDFVGGPIASYVVSGFAPSLQVGASVIDANGAGTKTGVIALLGLSHAF